MKNFKKVVLMISVVALLTICFACGVSGKKKGKNTISANVNGENIAIDINDTEKMQQYAKEIKDASKYDTSIAEKTTWKKVHHDWVEPPEEDKVRVLGEDSPGYGFVYYYKGKRYAVSAADTGSGQRAIYRFPEDVENMSDLENDNRVMIVSPLVTLPIWQLLEELSLGDAIVEDLKDGAPVIDKTN